MIKPFFAVAGVTLFVSSCIWVLGHLGDPIKHIIFINHTHQPVQVMILPPPSAGIRLSRTNLTNDKTHTYVESRAEQNPNFINLPNIMDQQGYMFGIGYWTDEELANVSQNMGKLTISTADKTVIYTTPAQIEHLLKTNWKKSGKEQSIDIVIK